MKIKKILRFYFFAESLEKAFNNLILKNACDSAFSYGEGGYAEKICNLLEEKQELSRLWGYLDKIIGNLPKEDISALKDYAVMRCGIKKLCEGKRREIKRAAVKFTRRARRLECFDAALGLVGKYCCLIL